MVLSVNLTIKMVVNGYEQHFFLLLMIHAKRDLLCKQKELICILFNQYYYFFFKWLLCIKLVREVRFPCVCPRVDHVYEVGLHAGHLGGPTWWPRRLGWSGRKMSSSKHTWEWNSLLYPIALRNLGMEG